MTHHSQAVISNDFNAGKQSYPWYALKVRTRSETAITSALRMRGYVPYCPTVKSRRQFSDRVKVIDAPVFPGYVFCQFDAHKKLPIISTPGVEYVLGYSDCPAAVPEQELMNVQRMIEAGASPVRSLSRGQKVRVTQGALEGIEGTLIRDQEGSQLMVSIELLNQGACLRIPDSAVCPVD